MSNGTTTPPRDPERWLDKEANRDKLKMAGGALAAIVIAGWAVFQWAQSRPERVGDPRTTMLTYKICAGEDERKCGDHDKFIGCSSIEKWVKNICAEADWGDVTKHGGGQCGYTIATVTCLQRVGR
jgi:hypothetical protein